MWTTRSSSKSRNRCLPAESAPRNRPPSRRWASSAKRPWGLLTATSRPPNAPERSSASRRSVCPSGIRLGRVGAGPPPHRGFRERGQVAGLLVGGEHLDPPGVAALGGEVGPEEQLDE